MQAALLQNKDIVVTDIAEPTPGEGELLVKTLACGICGSDLHTARKGEELVELSRKCGHPHPLDLQSGLVLGHEFCAEILDYGPNCDKTIPVGSRVCALPQVMLTDRMEYLGFSNLLPGGFAQRMVLSEQNLFVVPEHLSTNLAALTEPLSVVWHALSRASISERHCPLVVGCGPIGLATIALLKSRNISPIVAIEPSAKRRELAKKMGADIAVSSLSEGLYENWVETNLSANKLNGAMTSSPWVVFNCVGSRGVLDDIIMAVPRQTNIVQIGMCIEQDTIQQAIASPKEITLTFSHGYSGSEFQESLNFLAESAVLMEPMITKTIGLSDVKEQIFGTTESLEQGKVMVNPLL